MLAQATRRSSTSVRAIRAASSSPEVVTYISTRSVPAMAQPPIQPRQSAKAGRHARPLNHRRTRNGSGLPVFLLPLFLMHLLANLHDQFDKAVLALVQFPLAALQLFRRDLAVGHAQRQGSS